MFPQGPSDGRYLASSSSDEFSNGLINLNLGAGRPISVESDISTVINKRNTTNDNDNFDRLKIFDTVFIVDDIGSMVLTARDDDLEGQDRWDVTKEALWQVTALAAAKDDDRIDIRFLTSTSLDKDHITSVTKVMEIRDRLDVLYAFRGGATVSRTEICPRLEFFGQYREQDAASKSTNLKDLARIKRPQPPKKLSIIVITDGQADDKQEVEDLIVKTARELDIKGSRGSGWNAVRADW